MRILNLVAVSIVVASLSPCHADDSVKVDTKVMRRRHANLPFGITQSVEQPPGFPAPVYTSGQVDANFALGPKNSPPAYSATILTKDSQQAVAAWYRQKFSTDGWKLQNNPPTHAEKIGKVNVVCATKGNTGAMVTVQRDKKDSLTIVNVSTYTLPPTEKHSSK